MPNHMAIPTPAYLNRQLWETLRLGRESDTAHWFDVDWEYGDGRLSMPILGDSLDEVLASGEITFGEHEGEDVLRYGDHVLPMAPGSRSDDHVSATLASQHYCLAGWREKAQTLNYRRFFDVDTLVAIRVEQPDVFDASHATLLDLHRRGVIDGFRIDHPDGLADPQGYLERLRDATGGAWVVVEKILEPGERLPSSWPCAGTTGYEAIRAIQGALVPAVGPELDMRWQAIGGEPSYDRAELGSKRLVVADLFQAEVRWLARSAVAAANAAGTALTTTDARAALAEMLAHVEVYRAYLRPGFPPEPEALDRLTAIAARAREARPDLAESIGLLTGLLAETSTEDPAGRDLVVRFQQVCGPVMAKGVEDTTFYRWHRMIGLNEVGGDPRAVDSPDVGLLHAWADDQVKDHPTGMTGLSTHDTKRSEDVRARLLAAVENLEGWDRSASRYVTKRPSSTSMRRPPTSSRRPSSAAGPSPPSGSTTICRRPFVKPSCSPRGTTPTNPTSSASTTWARPVSPAPSRRPSPRWSQRTRGRPAPRRWPASSCSSRFPACLTSTRARS